MDRMEAILRRYGQRALLRRREGETEVRAFVQPLPERGEDLPQNPASLGWADKRRWLYLGREALEPGDGVVWAGRVFQARSVRPWRLGEDLLYYQAFLEAGKEAAEE